MTAIRKLFIANRGEIALRIVRTAQRLGIETVVPCTGSDRAGPALAVADRAVEVTGEPPVAACLDAQARSVPRRASGGDAIHPGYGFLSENADFARAVADAGLVFVGPPADAIELMGDKIRARAFVAQHGFPVAPSAIEDDDPKTFVERARAVGFPLLIKPPPAAAARACASCATRPCSPTRSSRARSEGRALFRRRPALSSSATSSSRATSRCRCWATRTATSCICSSANARCSAASRRSIEETPVAGAGAATSARRICETAARHRPRRRLSQCRHGRVHLSRDGRVLLPGDEHAPAGRASGDRDGHRPRPGREQLRVAAGEKLGFAQERVHSVRATRSSAGSMPRTPARGFTPTTGKVLVLRGRRARACASTAASSQGQAITAAFDPMLAKLIVHGADRARRSPAHAQALARPRAARLRHQRRFPARG